MRRTVASVQGDAAGPAPGAGTYLYGIVRSSHPLRLDGRGGIGAQPAALRRIDVGDLVVVASDAPERLRAKRRDLLAHQQVLEDLCAQGATLPMRFGSVADGDDTVRHQVAAEADRYASLLSEVDGRVEVNLKVVHHEETVLRELLASNPDLRRHHEQLQHRGGGSRDDQVRFGELVSRAVEAREADDAGSIVASLRPHVARESTGPRVRDCFLNVSFLVDRGRLAGFEAAVDELDHALGEAVRIRLQGPLPPYSFTEPTQAG
jgi:hypothetical protein